MAEAGSRCVVQGGGEVAARSIRRRREVVAEGVEREGRTRGGPERCRANFFFLFSCRD
jgi:hypothetical protein